MIIPGIIISILTFPGVILHEFSHKLFCRMSNVKVIETKYFRFGNPAGYVIHEKPHKFFQTFLISTGPLIFNTLVALILFFIASLFIGVFNGVILWLGISVAMHSFPSKGDAKNLWKETNEHIKNNFFAVLGYPFVIIIFAADILRIVWFDLIYAIFLIKVVTPNF